MVKWLNFCFCFKFFIRFLRVDIIIGMWYVFVFCRMILGLVVRMLVVLDFFVLLFYGSSSEVFLEEILFITLGFRYILLV